MKTNNNKNEQYNNTTKKNITEKYGDKSFEKLVIAFMAASTIASANNISKDNLKNNQELKNAQEISINEMNNKIFLPHTQGKQYIVDPNKVQNVITLSNGLAIQGNDRSKNLNIVTENGISYIDTNSRDEVLKELKTLLDSYKKSKIDYDNKEFNNLGRIKSLDQSISNVEADIENTTKELSKIRNEYSKENNRLDKTRNTIIDYTNKLSNDNDKKLISELLNKKAELFDKREKFFGLTNQVQDKDSLQKEIDVIKSDIKNILKSLTTDDNGKKILLDKNMKQIIYKFNEYDSSISSLERFNQKLENRELELINMFNNIKDMNEQKLDLANSEQIISFKNDPEFLETIKSHIRYSETSNDKGEYNKVGDIGDGAGISFGSYQFTEASGMLKKYLIELSQNGFPEAKALANKMVMVDQKDKNGNIVLREDGSVAKVMDFKGDDKQLMSFLAKVGNSEASVKIQDGLYEKYYLQKAYNLIDDYNLNNPNNQILDKSAVAQIVDHFLNAGSKGATQMIAKCKGDFSPENVREARIEHYEAIVKNNPDKAKFLDGWTNRTNNCYERLAEFSDEKELEKQQKSNKVASLDFQEYYKNIKNPDVNLPTLQHNYEISRS